ncbi:hypothetical protein SH1V18_06390 [Vallitalea longa]|uniref:SLH domain-containing protein n=1 Tax=Vallitalea longa TaxID=2936439 RepID=A0A9W6DF04_9FIRM|nr:S-layer homology domain-containing protein [Vallitalea longa]GKX28159.1 hypothetical protein SH1V18_06390 [Vallitalea longa]
MNNNFRNSKLIFIFILTFLFTGSFAYADFSDLQGHWAKDCINKWAGNGVINGFNDGTVHPNDDITRAEFVKIINKIFNFTEKASKNYSDVKSGQWYTDNFAKAKQAGYLKDFVDAKALPTKELNREQAATILYNVLQMQTTKSSESKTFTDTYEISEYASEPVKVLYSKGFINGYPDGSFKPSNVIKRSEALKMVDNVIKGYFNKKGTYSNQKLKGSAIINTSGVTLKDVEIQGDLYLTEGIEEGEVTLQNVEVSGKTYINGGGENSVYFIDSTIEDVIVNKANGKVRLVSKGESNIKNVILESGAKLEEESIAKKYNGFKDVEVSEKVPCEQDAEFSGDFEGVTISSSNELTFDDCDIEQVEIKGNDDRKIPTVKMLKATVKSLVSKAEGAKIEMKKGTKVESIALEEKTDLSVDRGAEVGKLSIDKDAKGTDIDIDGKVKKVANDATDVKANGKTIKKGSNVSTSTKSSSSSSSHHSSGGSSSTSTSDTTKPVIENVASSNVEVSATSTWEAPATKASDNKDGDITSKIKIAYTSDDSEANVTNLTSAREHLKTVGNTVIVTYTVSDTAGNSATAVVATFTAVDYNTGEEDTTAPVITGVENNKEYQTKVTPVSTDTDIKTVTLTKGDTAVSYKLGTDITEAGEYILTVTDNAGNITKINFAIKTIISDEIDFNPIVVASFIENNDEIRFNTHGIITASIDTSKLIYKTSKDAIYGYGLSDKYVLVDLKSDLKQGEYCYLDIGDDTYINMKLFSKDAKAIKSLDGYGNVSDFPNNDNDRLEASEGWYSNAKAGIKSMQISNDIKVNLKTSIQGGVFVYGSDGILTDTRRLSGNENSNETILVNTHTKKIVFYKGEYDPTVDPTSGEMKIIKYKDDFIENGITVDDSNWIPVTEDNFGKEDTTAPIITGVENNKEYQTKVTPVSTDTDIKTVTLTKGNIALSYKLGTDITEAGEYILTVTDNAGNITKISFTIKTTIIDEIGFNTEQDILVDFAYNTNEIRFTVKGNLTEDIDTTKFKYLDSEDINANFHTLQKYVKVDDTSKLVAGSYSYIEMVTHIDGKEIGLTQIYLKLNEEDANKIQKLEGLGNPNCYVGQGDILVADDGWYSDVKGGTKFVNIGNKIKITFENTIPKGVFSYNKNNYNFSSSSIDQYDDVLWIDEGTDKLIFTKDEYNFKLSGEIKIIKVTEDIINNGIVIDDKDWIDAPKLTHKTIDATHKILTLKFNKNIGFNDVEYIKQDINISKDNGEFVNLSDDDEVIIVGEKLIITFKNPLTNNDKIKIYRSTLKDKDEVAIHDVIINVFDCSIDEKISFTYPNRYSQFIENNNRLDIDIIGNLTQEVNINKLTYTTSSDVAYKLQSNYQKVGHTNDLEPGKYCYSQSSANTTICIELTTEDAEAIKKLDDYGNNTIQYNDNDSIVAEDGWYANISGGSNTIYVENEMNLKNISDVSGLYCYNENNEQLESFSKECIREEYMMINAGTRKMVFYKGNETSGNNPSSGEILIKNIDSDIIKNDIDAGVGEWKLIPELQSAEIDETNKIVTLTFSKKINEYTNFIYDFKSNIEIATDGNNFEPLDSNDIVEITGGQVVVTFDNALTTNANRIKIAENTLVDEDDYVLGVEVVTDVIDASGVDEVVTDTVSVTVK